MSVILVLLLVSSIYLFCSCVCLFGRLALLSGQPSAKCCTQIFGDQPPWQQNTSFNKKNTKHVQCLNDLQMRQRSILQVWPTDLHNNRVREEVSNRDDSLVKKITHKKNLVWLSQKKNNFHFCTLYIIYTWLYSTQWNQWKIWYCIQMRKVN